MTTRGTSRSSFSTNEIAGRQRCEKLNIPADASQWDALEAAAAINYWQPNNPRDAEASAELRRRREVEVRGEQWTDDALWTMQSSKGVYTHPFELRWKVMLDKDRYVRFPQVGMTHPDFEHWQMQFGRSRKAQKGAGDKKSELPMTSRRTDASGTASFKQWCNAGYDDPASPVSSHGKRGKFKPAKSGLADPTLNDWQMYLQPAPPNVDLNHPMFQDWLMYFGSTQFNRDAPVQRRAVPRKGDKPSQIHAKTAASRKRKARVDDNAILSTKATPAARRKRQRRQ